MLDADIEIKLLGDPSIKRGDADLTPSVRKSMALVAYLALEGPTHRDRLADLLWSDMEQKDARRNLRQELWRLQRSLLTGLLESKSDQVFLRSGCSTDVQHFQSKLAQGDTGAALEGYGGPLLAHFELSGAAQFEDWLEVRRDALSALHKDALQQHAETLETAGDLRGALSLVLRLLHEDEFQEVYQREAMRLHLNLGERGAALLRFERYARLLEEELGLQPLPETEALARSLHDTSAHDPSAEGLLPEAASQGRGLRGPQGLVLPLVGREAQWDTLAGSTAALTVLTGEPGVGKTRLTETFAATFGVQLHLRFFEVSLETPLYPAAEALRTALADPRGRERLSYLDPVWRTEAARLVPELEPAGVATPQLEGRARFLTGVARALMCAAGPEGVLIFDDLHWADPSSLELLLHLTRARHDTGPRLLATARSRELSEHSLLSAALTTLEREGRLCRITLLPLSAPEVLQLVQILSGNPAQLFAAQLFAASSGNPLYLLETLRHLFETGALRQDAAGEWSTPFDASTQDYAELPLPSSVRNAIVQRTEHHGPAARRLLEAASLLGEGFRLDDLAPALSLSDWESLEALEGLLEAGLMTRLQGGGYGFSHELVRRVMLEELGPERRRLIHRRLAERLEKTAAPAHTLAHHLEAAGHALQAAKWRVRAAQDAAQVYAHREALEHYRKALEDGLAPLEAFAVRTARVQLYRFLGEMAAWEAELVQMERLTHDLEPSELQISLRIPLQTPLRIEVQLSRANFFVDAGQYTQALEEAERLLSATGLTPEQRAGALRFAGHALGKLGRTQEGEKRLHQALEGSGELSHSLRGSVHNDLTNLALDRGDLGAARQHSGMALECFRASGELRAQAIALNSSARIAYMSGDEPTALSRLQNALSVSQMLGDVHLQVVFLHNMVQMQVDRGHLAEALEALNAGLTAVSEPRSPVHEGMLRSRAADVYRLQGELGAALESDLLAIGLADEIGALNVQITRRVHHAHFRVALGDLGAARRCLTEASELAQAGELQVTLEVGWAELELAQGQAKKALERLNALQTTHERTEPGEFWTFLQLTKGAALLALDPLTDLRILPHLPQRPALRAFALRLRLGGSMLDPDDEAEVRALLATGRVSPLETLNLKLALAHALKVAETHRESEVRALHAEARALHLRLNKGLSAEQSDLFDTQVSVWMNPRSLLIHPPI